MFIRKLFTDSKLWVKVFFRLVAYVYEFESLCWYERKNKMITKKI